MATADRHGERGRRVVAWMALSIAVVAGFFDAGSATAAVPGTNGKIAFGGSVPGDGVYINTANADGAGRVMLGAAVQGRFPAWSADGQKVAFAGASAPGKYAVYSMNADGSGVTRLTSTTQTYQVPTWSPDGSKIAFTRDGVIWTMNADGSEQVQVTGGTNPAWSPDGMSIVFERSSGAGVYAMNPDGSGQTFLAPGGGANWSPDGRRIAFTSGREIYVMNRDGSARTKLTTPPATANAYDRDPAWSPDGARIVFVRSDGGAPNLFVMNPDGTKLTRITTTSSGEYEPDWQPRKPPTVVNDSLVAKSRNTFEYTGTWKTSTGGNRYA